MPIDVEALKNWHFPVAREAYSEKDTILYALALGYGSDPTSEAQLKFVYERHLRAVPTLASVLCHPGFWLSDPRTGVDASKAVHGEQSMRFHGALGPSGVLRGHCRVTAVIDKGSGTGALVVIERTLHDDATGDLVATIEQRTLCRGDGGFAGPSPVQATQSERIAPPAKAAIPEEPTHRVEIRSLPQAALIFRLSADPNALHVDPATAAAAGYPRPILHGLCTFGIAARAILESCCGNDPTRLRALKGRFSAPAYPGETICTEIFREETGRDATGYRFRCLVRERGAVILSQGHADCL
jgi:acyl dehydratase